MRTVETLTLLPQSLQIHLAIYMSSEKLILRQAQHACRKFLTVKFGLPGT